jgi:hypothetical protein
MPGIKSRRSPFALSLVGAAWASLAIFTSCSTQPTYDRVPTTGKFSGEPRMVAIAPNTFFFFQPKEDTKFAFTTHANVTGAGKAGGRGQYQQAYAHWTIVPEDMITTGASVPRRFWYIRGFGSFDYTRAAIIHDWLFEAHHRWLIAKNGYDEAKAHGDGKAMSDYAVDCERYKKYGLMSQGDAADIFAECIRVTMGESEAILRDFEQLGTAPPNTGKKSLARENLEELKDALRVNKPSPRTLWAYHYFVSPDCFVHKSTAMWEDQTSDLELYRLLSSPTVVGRAKEKGYLSPWIFRRFERVLAAAEKRHGDYQSDHGADGGRPAGKEKLRSDPSPSPDSGLL